jgi:UDP-glucose 4-epimerase
MRTALITGGAGFIGSHLTEALLDRGWRVIVVDNLAGGSTENLRHLADHPGLEYRLGTTLDEGLMDRLVERSDHVYHLAASVGVFKVFEQPGRSVVDSFRSTETILRLAKGHGKKILIASTSEVYGKSTKLPFNEDDDLVIGPSSQTRWSYASSKLLNEVMALSYHRETGCPVVVVRLFNVCGPRQSSAAGMVIPRMVEQALSGRPLTVFGDGSQSRCFSYVGEVVTAMIDLMALESSAGEVYNIGNPHEVTVRELAILIANKVGGPAYPIAFIPHEEAYANKFEDIQRRIPDITKVQKAVGFTPVVQLDEILDQVIEYTRRKMHLASGEVSSATQA